MSDIKKIAVLTSGGDAPGMNFAVRAVVYSAFRFGPESEVSENSGRAVKAAWGGCIRNIQ